MASLRLWLYSLRGIHRVMISINEAIAPLQRVGGGSGVCFFPLSARPWKFSPKNGATSLSLPLPPPPLLLHYARTRDASRGGNLASSQNRAELIGKLQGSAAPLEPLSSLAHPSIHCLFLIFSRTLRRPSPTPLPTAQRRRRRRPPRQQVKRQPRQGLLRRRRIRSHVRRRRETSPHRSLRSLGSPRVSAKSECSRRGRLKKGFQYSHFSSLRTVKIKRE